MGIPDWVPSWRQAPCGRDLGSEHRLYPIAWSDLPESWIAYETPPRRRERDYSTWAAADWRGKEQLNLIHETNSLGSILDREEFVEVFSDHMQDWTAVIPGRFPFRWKWMATHIQNVQYENYERHVLPTQ